MQNFTIMYMVMAIWLTIEVKANLLDNELDDFQRGGQPEAAAAIRQIQRRPFMRGYTFKRCNKCPTNKCQVLGMQRYAEPTCEPFGGLGAPCRMWQEPENKTLHYPESILRCNDVYMQLCPCGSSLVCREAECKYETDGSPRGQAAEAIKLLHFDLEDDSPADQISFANEGWTKSVYSNPMRQQPGPTSNNVPEPLDPRRAFGSSQTQWSWPSYQYSRPT